MGIKKFANALSCIGLLAVWFTACPLSMAGNQNPDDIVAKYLDSLGTPQARAAAKSRLNEGSAQFKALVGGGSFLTGEGQVLSEGRKLQVLMKFPNNDYTGEQFIFDGDKLLVNRTTGRQNRSALGEFVYTQDAMVKEGLLSGELSTGFPLLDLNQRQAKLSYKGEKKIDGQRLLDVLYKPKKSTDLEIHLYFDPDTYRHVMTVYTLRVNAQLAQINPQVSNAQVANNGDVANGALLSPTGGIVTQNNETLSARQQETRYRLEERFSDFKAVDGLTLPSHYNLQFAQELGNGRTTLNQWDISVQRTSDNINLDPKNFDVP